MYYALSLLERDGYVSDAEASVPSGQAAFGEALGLDARSAEHRLRTSTVALFTFGAASSDSFEATLAALDLRTGKDGELTVALTDD